MKKTTVALIVVACIIAAVGVYFVTGIVRSQSIVVVLNQNAQNARDCTQVFAVGNRTRRRFNTRKFVDKLQGNDTSACPKKFQLAWLDYVHCWEREREQTPGVVLSEAYLGMIGVATRSSSLSRLTTKPIETADALETAWQNLETVALEYGVRVIHKTEQ
jgi:hypothetical protein